MVYRIRFRQTRASDESEVVLEANSPTEALVKFRHTSVAAEPAVHVVTSVTADEHEVHRLA